jgi:hypothetical protein
MRCHNGVMTVRSIIAHTQYNTRAGAGVDMSRCERRTHRVVRPRARRAVSRTRARTVCACIAHTHTQGYAHAELLCADTESCILLVSLCTACVRVCVRVCAIPRGARGCVRVLHILHAHTRAVCACSAHTQYTKRQRGRTPRCPPVASVHVHIRLFISLYICIRLFIYIIYISSIFLLCVYTLS